MLKIIRGGVLSTIQDAGRIGVQALGVTPGGAVDDLALRVGNWIVGNPATAPAIEMTLQGMDVVFTQDTLISLTGAPLCARDTSTPIPMWRPLWVRQGQVLSLGNMQHGARSYLCLQGGIITSPLLGGAGADLRNGFGGVFGRALQTDDRLTLATQERRYPLLFSMLRQSSSGMTAAPWQVSVWREWSATSQRPLSLLSAGQQEELNDIDRCALYQAPFRVLPASDRQALRLHGPTLHVSRQRQRSAGACFGLVQLPADGNPIVLLADHQTTGGYPVIGVVASIARSRLAQARPGDILHFEPVMLEQAHSALAQREHYLDSVRRELLWRMKNG